MLRAEFLVDGDRPKGKLDAPHVGAKDFPDGTEPSEAIAEFSAEVLANHDTRKLIDENGGIKFSTRNAE